MVPSSQRSRVSCNICHKSFASMQSLGVHSQNCKKCQFCNKRFTGTGKTTGARNFEMHEERCFRRALNMPSARGLSLNNPPAMGGDSGLSALPGSSGNPGDAVLVQTSDMDPLGQQEADNGMNSTLNSLVELQSSARIPSHGFPSSQDLRRSGDHVEQVTPMGLLAPLSLSGPQVHKQQQLQQPEQQTRQHRLSPVHNLEMASDGLLSEQNTPMESLSTLHSIPRMQFGPVEMRPTKRHRPTVQGIVGSSGLLNVSQQGLALSEIMLHAPSSHRNEDTYGERVPSIRGPDGSRDHMQETLKNMSISPVNQVDLDSSVRIPLPVIQQPSSGVQVIVASASQSNIFPQGLTPAERMLPVGISVSCPLESDNQNIFGGGNEVPIFQASARNSNCVENTLENMGNSPLNQVDFDSETSMLSPVIQQNNLGEDDNSNEGVWSGNLWNWD